MKQEIIQNVLANSELDAEQQLLLEQVMVLTENLLALPEEIPEGRWLAMGHHLAEAIKRTLRSESLDPIDAETMAQIESVYQEKGYQILRSMISVGENICSTPEVALFAIHLQCAANGF